MDAAGFLQSLRASGDYRKQIVHIQRIPRRGASFEPVDPPVSGQTGDALSRLGTSRFYSHQAEAIHAVRRGEHIVVVTGTASGKTLCYNVPVMESLEQNPRARALYIFPTKALAQDQLGKLNRYGIESLKAATYDGDTPRQERPFIKVAANIVLTNPDMLHIGILPYHTTWSELFRNLEYVVIDEVHTYRGVFGAHVANIIRRLRRVASYYGSYPRFVCASATVTGPGKLVADLTGIDARVIDNDGSPAGEKTFVFWNPPYLARKGERRSANSESVELFVNLVKSHVRTIVFVKARKTAELILRYARTRLSDEKSALADRIMAYRAGYRPAERREIEKRLFSGELMGVTSTTALEVGVDIGGLDAVVMTGYPGTVAGTWQQAGRSGRGTEQSIAVLIGLDNPIDQYIMRNPGYFFGSEHERAIIDSQNPYILADHILCAAYEIPIENAEVEELFGERTWEVLGLLEEVGQVQYRRRWYWTGSDYPAKDVNIRSASGGSYNIVSIEKGGALLGTVDEGSAFDMVHPGAVYLHGGDSYVVTRLDTEQKVAYVERSDVNYYTTSGDTTRVSVEESLEARAIGGAAIGFGDVQVANQVTCFWRKQLFTDQNIDKVPLDLPETQLNTEAVWVAIPQRITDVLIGRGLDLHGAIHAIEHCSIGILPLFALCDRNDIGGVSHPAHPDTDGLAVVFIYDGRAGGVGIARTAYDRIEDLLAATLKTMEDCACDEGCPSCVQSPKCGSNNEPLDKPAAIYLLRQLLSP